MCVFVYQRCVCVLHAYESVHSDFDGGSSYRRETIASFSLSTNTNCQTPMAYQALGYLLNSFDLDNLIDFRDEYSYKLRNVRLIGV